MLPRQGNEARRTQNADMLPGPSRPAQGRVNPPRPVRSQTADMLPGPSRPPQGRVNPPRPDMTQASRTVSNAGKIVNNSNFFKKSVGLNFNEVNLHKKQISNIKMKLGRSSNKHYSEFEKLSNNVNFLYI